MNADMTIRAVLIARVGHVVSRRKHRNSRSRAAKVTRSVVALQAESKNNRPAQKPGIGRAVRRMAHFASLDADRRMFKGKRAAFVGVTLQTCFFICQPLIHQCRPRRHPPVRGERSMRIVAITAFHKTFIHAMLKRHGKFCPDIAVTAVTKRWLIFRQQELGAF